MKEIFFLNIFCIYEVEGMVSVDKIRDVIIISIDAGGTMTDCIAVREDGSFLLGKALTNYADESYSFGESIKDALNDKSPDLSRLRICAYAGTLLLNAVLTRRGLKTGLLTTRGFEHLIYFMRGHSWLGYSYVDKLHSVTHIYPDVFPGPLVPVDLIKGVNERIDTNGRIVIPLNEEDVKRGVNELLDKGCQSIAVSYLNSTMNPVHEIKTREIAKEVINERGLNVHVVLSSEVSPRGKETERTVSTVIQAFAAEPAANQLLRVETKAREMGFKGNLYTVLSYGGLVDIRYPRLYETLISGPIGGVLGSKFVGDILGEKNIVATDLGGTSFDVGIIKDGIIHIEREPEVARYMLSLPMVRTDSIAAGAGMVVRVDPVSKLITLGPESAGYRVGICLDYHEVTISDCNVVLGYLNPNYFLGGKVKLNRDKALKAIEEKIAQPLGLDVYNAAYLAIASLHAKMSDWLNATLMARGYTPLDYILLCYGGAGPLHMWGFDVIPFKDYITFKFAAGFSAFGNSTVDYMIREHKSVNISIPPNPDAETIMKVGEHLNSAWEDLENRQMKILTSQGFSTEQIIIKQIAYMRFAGQLEDHEVFSPRSRILKPEDFDDLMKAFESVYTSIYPKAALFPEAGIVIKEVATLALVTGMPKPKIIKKPLSGEKPPESAFKGQREVFYEKNWVTFDVWEMDPLQPGNKVYGPAIIEHPMTTLVVPPQRRIYIDEYEFIHYSRR
ncbi:MAG: hydantoinase/oxoprolinase family protein [Candidatus Bathyarchaeia archaeon]|nr:hydantoinase/oxoprolinase family protein [Candidatus Bathyarchaeota archaeon]